jgi:Cytochrome c554 and c-prime
MEKSDEPLYAGSMACKSCHEGVYKSHQLTPHHLTSQLADSISIKGSFEEGKNIFFYSPERFIIMDKKQDQFFQVLYHRGEKVKSKSFDFVLGSGVRGQAYVSWQDSTLFQLPVGYFTSVHTWANSPGFSNRPIFNRPITSRCLECHSTFFKKTLTEKEKYPEHFSKKNFIIGIECEKCHGPGKKHVDFHQGNEQVKEGKFIVSYKDLSRKQELDFCRSCHGGKLLAKKPAFSFKAGDDLNDSFQTDSVQTPSAPLDSHGNQFGMLSQSKCFLKSNITCITCHQVHENEKGKVLGFSSRCMTCHTEGTKSFCSFKQLAVSQLKQNCIQCHMPEKNSNSIRMLLQGESIPTPAKMHVHHIAVYQDEIIRYINSLPINKN